MWIYEKKLQYPVKIKNPNPKLAQIIISQLGGPDGELAASMRYLHQRYSCPYDKITGILTDVGTEELAHRCWKYIKLTKKERSRMAPLLFLFTQTGRFNSVLKQCNIFQ